MNQVQYSASFTNSTLYVASNDTMLLLAFQVRVDTPGVAAVVLTFDWNDGTLSLTKPFTIALTAAGLSPSNLFPVMPMVIGAGQSLLVSGALVGSATYTLFTGYAVS